LVACHVQWLIACWQRTKFGIPDAPGSTGTSERDGINQCPTQSK
jgi:hypothetical protein